MNASAPDQPAPTSHLPGLPDYLVLGEPPASSNLTARATLLGTRIDIRQLSDDPAIAAAAERSGLNFIFRYGVVVCLHVGDYAGAQLETALRPHVHEPAAATEIETANLSVSPESEEKIGTDGRLHLVDASPERLSLVATVLARSVVLARNETQVSEAFDRIAPLVSDLRVNGRARLPIKQVMKLVGEVLAARHGVLGTAQAGERPELPWEHPELDRLYARLEREFELVERAEVLERKFGALGAFTEVLLNIVQGKRGFRLEAAIIALIAFEILLTLFDMAVR